MRPNGHVLPRNRLLLGEIGETLALVEDAAQFQVEVGRHSDQGEHDQRYCAHHDPKGESQALRGKEQRVTLYLEHRIEVNCEYDEDEDILYAWVGDEPRAAITYETDEGHLVRLDPETKDLVGVTVLDYRARWEDKPINITWEAEVEQPVPWIPLLSRKRREHVAERRVLHRIGKQVTA